MAGGKPGDEPFNVEFGGPSLVISAEVDPQTFTTYGADSGGWGGVCPLLEDRKSGDILEYCIGEWRGPNDPEMYATESLQECSGYLGHTFDMVHTLAWTGTIFSEQLGASSFVVPSSGWRHFEERITAADLEAAAARDNLAKKENAKKINEGGCAPRSTSTNPADYTLLGIEEGTEGWRELNTDGNATRNLQVRTEYTANKPSATTEAASNLEDTEEKLNGTVNPNGPHTHYYFQYGETTSYGTQTGEGDAGNGRNNVHETTTITGLQPGMTYHYRLVATSWAGTEYGKDETFMMPSAPVALFDPSGNGCMYVATEGSNHAMYITVDCSGTWSGPYQEVAPGAVYSTPSVSTDEGGDIFWTYEGYEHKFEVLVRKGGTGTFEGPFQEAAAGSVYSAPSSSSAEGSLFWTYEGASNAFDVLVRNSSGVSGPYQEAAPGSVFSAPSSSSAEGSLFWTYEGASNAFDVLVRNSSGVSGPYQEAAPGSVFSAPSSGQDKTGELFWSYRAANNAFDVLVRTPSTVLGPYQEAAPGTTFSAPATSPMDSAGDFFWFFAGPNDTLSMEERSASGAVTGPTQIGGPGTTD